MAKAFEFADFVEEFWVDFFISRRTEGRNDPEQGNKWVRGVDLDLPGGGIVLPMSPDDMKNEVNGVYTTLDRKIYTTMRLEIGDEIIYNAQKFKVHQYKDYEAYADVFIYFAKAENRGITL